VITRRVRTCRNLNALCALHIRIGKRKPRRHDEVTQKFPETSGPLDLFSFLEQFPVLSRSPHPFHSFTTLPCYMLHHRFLARGLCFQVLGCLNPSYHDICCSGVWEPNMDIIDIVTCYRCINVRFIRMLPTHRRLGLPDSLFMFSDQNFVCISHSSHACYMWFPSLPLAIDHHHDNIWEEYML
jgi:hypothetical protein